MRGKKTPTKIKKLKGTFRADESLENEMESPDTNGDEAPIVLKNEYAKKEWLKVTGVLSSLGMLKETDTSSLLAYCMEMGKYFTCQDILDEKGYTTVSVKTGYEQQRPEVSIGNSALQSALKIAGSFGFNPAARTKIEMPVQKPKDKGLSGLL
jgi:P27 family predicted phage terminase small subunit